MSFGTTRPVHDRLLNVPDLYVGTSLTLSLSSRYQASLVGFSNPPSSGSNLGTGYGSVIALSLVPTTFKVIIPFSVSITPDDGFGFQDSTTLTAGIKVNDPLNFGERIFLSGLVTNDDAFDFNDLSKVVVMPGGGFDDALNLHDGPAVLTPGFYPTGDGLDFDDSFVLLLDMNVQDAFNFHDSTVPRLIPEGGFDDAFNLHDHFLLNMTIHQDDAFNFHDVLKTSHLYSHEDAFNFSDSVKVRTSYHRSYSQETQIRHRFHESYSQETQILHYTPWPISDIYDVSNPVSPTVIVLGSTIVSNSPTNTKGSGDQISLDLSGLGCDVESLQMSESIGSAGEFTIKAQTSKGAIGTFLNIYGVPCLILGSYSYQDNNSEGYITKGSIGDIRIFNKQLLLLGEAPGIAAIQSNLPIPLQSVPSLQWKTISSVANAIALTASMPFNWMTIDAPLTDTFLETGLSVGDALRSLAGRVGGILIPTNSGGGTGWVVTDYVGGYGGWQGIANCGLWGQGGVSVGSDYENRVQTILFPVKLLAQGNAQFIANPLTNPSPPPIITAGTTGSKVKDPAPAWEVQLPADFGADNTLQFRIVVAPDSPMIGLPFVVIQGDTQTWSTISPTIQQRKDGTTWALIDKSFFDSGLVDGQFTAIIGYLKDQAPATAAYAEAFSLGIQQKKLLQQAELMRLKYFRTSVFQGSMVFAGSLPRAGNITSLSFNGRSITDGIVENWSLAIGNNNYNLGVGAGKYARVNLTTPTSYLDYWLATGQTPPY